MFDPAKVERKTGVLDDANVHAGEADDVFVLASDYDQLLEIHLRHINTIIDLFNRCGEPLSAEAIVNLKNGTWR